MRFLRFYVVLTMLLHSVSANAETYCLSKGVGTFECLNGHYNVCLWNGQLTWAKTGYPVRSGRLSIMILDEPVVAPPCAGSSDTETMTFCRWSCSGGKYQ